MIKNIMIHFLTCSCPHGLSPVLSEGHLAFIGLAVVAVNDILNRDLGRRGMAVVQEEQTGK